MRLPSYLTLLFLLGCDDDTGSPSSSTGGPRIMCREVVYAAAWVGEATLFNYDDEPSTADVLAHQSSAVVRGHLVSVQEGELSDAPVGTSMTDVSVLFELEVDKVYKGRLQKKDHVSLRLPRDGNVVREHLATLNASLPSAYLTAFLVEETEQHETVIPDVPLRYVLPSPQGLIVSASCATSQPLVSDPLFDPLVTTDRELDKAVEAALRE